jgi:hypothetical protein
MVAASEDLMVAASEDLMVAAVFAVNAGPQELLQRAVLSIGKEGRKVSLPFFAGLGRTKRCVEKL